MELHEKYKENMQLAKEGKITNEEFLKNSNSNIKQFTDQLYRSL